MGIHSEKMVVVIAPSMFVYKILAPLENIRVAVGKDFLLMMLLVRATLPVFMKDSIDANDLSEVARYR